MMTELQLIENTAKLLADSGKSFLTYTTAALQPFSNQQRPDLIFTPKSGGSTVFVEFKRLKTANSVESSYINSLDDRIEFVLDELSQTDVIYVLAVDGTICDKDKYLICSKNIKVFENISDENTLANCINTFQ